MSEKKTDIQIRTLLELQLHKAYANEEKTAVLVGSPLHKLLMAKWVRVDGVVAELQKIMEKAHLDALKECIKNKSQDANYYDGIRDGTYDILSMIDVKEE